MDSRLLNAFHDDHFDGNYGKYETDATFWSSENETLGLQLTETLHGILPISPTDDSSDFYNHAAIIEDKYSIQTDTANANTYIKYDINSSISPESIEIISVDPNGNCDSLLNTDDEDSTSSDGDIDDEIDDEYRGSSRLTFRSRTDSSSIADYESHSSDYDDDESDIEEEGLLFNDSVNIMKMHSTPPLVDSNKRTEIQPVPARVEPTVAVHSNILQGDSFDIDKALINGTLIESEDVFDIDIDANSFDLATFITQDDINFQKISSMPPIVGGGKKKVVMQPIVDNKSDSDSDVDIETVEVDNVHSTEVWKEPEIIEAEPAVEPEVIDNVKKDPSWSPQKPEKVVKPTPKPEPPVEVAKPIVPVKSNIANKGKKSFSMIPSKRQADMLKGKFGLGRGKNLSMHRKPKPAKALPTPAPPQKKCNYTSDIDMKSPKKEESPVKAKPGKNIENIIKVEPLTPSTQSDCSDSGTMTESLVATLSNHPVRRKLNLEEYKKRREIPSPVISDKKEKKHSFADALTAANTVKPSIHKPSIQLQHKKTLEPVPKPKLLAPPRVPIPISIVKEDIKEPKKIFIDPITEAKNKVLRLQELKKAQQIKIIDSAVSAKVGRVTKLPPLKEIVKGMYPCNENEAATEQKPNPLYEEIIIVSAGCNTELTIPPVLPANMNFDKDPNSASRSLLKSSALLYNISNTIQKVKSVDSVKISSSSLISSIQDVVVKKTAPTPDESSGVIIIKKEKINGEEHGEDKIIMHLRKDRIRKRKFSASTQTDILPEFPPLPLPVRSPSKKEQTNRSRRKYRRHSYSSDDSSDRSRSRSYSSSSSTSSSTTSSGKKRYRQRKYKNRSERTISGNSSSESESDGQQNDRDRNRRLRNFSRSSNRSNSVMSTSSTGSRPSRHRTISRSRSRSRCSMQAKTKAPERNVSQPAVEERRIVYVGRIEDETTKEDLRRKFLAYGPIKQITIHYKDTGMKYGFVTYERAQDAFQVIDNGTRDGDINMYDISFGGRRAFCRASYADLDNAVMNNYKSSYSYTPPVVVKPKEDDSFEALLQKVKAKMSSAKPSNPQSSKT